MTEPVRIANFSGFYGDRRGAARELLNGSDRIDVLTGDYLAELTMLILWKAQQKNPQLGYATTFVDEMVDVLADCLARGIKVVTNAGGLNPAGLAAELTRRADELGLHPSIAVVDGDDLRGHMDSLVAKGVSFQHLETGQALAEAPAKPVTANTYLGGWGIAAALEHGADIVVTGRVTDASLVVGAAAWWHSWGRDSFNELAGAVAAGHIIECGPQTTGGNYSFPEELPNLRYPGFPIAEVAADGSSVITKQPGTGGLVSVGTVTAQLLYEIGSPLYANPDVTAHFDSIRLDDVGSDRVRVSGVRGSAPPDHLKVAINYPGGYRNSMTMVITGMDVRLKAAQAESMLLEVLGGADQFDELSVQLIDTGRADAEDNAEGTSLLRVTVKDQDPAKVGRNFSNSVTALALASYSGFYTTTPPQPASSFGVYWPALIATRDVVHSVTFEGGERIEIPHTPGQPWADVASQPGKAADPAFGMADDDSYVSVPLGCLCGARSGDKGGNANVGLWARSSDAFEWLAKFLSAHRFQRLLGEESAGLEVRRYLLPNLRAVNFVVVGLLGAGVASSSRYDPQAKGLGEYIRSRIVPVPARFLDERP